MRKGDTVRLLSTGAQGVVTRVERIGVTFQTGTVSTFAPISGVEVVEPTLVIFRKFKDGEVVAIFPTLRHGTNPNEFSSFVHFGQHGPCDRSLIDTTRLATPEEYAALKLELESEPYNYVLKIGKRWPK